MPDANDRIAIRRLGEADRGGWLALGGGDLASAAPRFRTRPPS